MIYKSEYRSINFKHVMLSYCSPIMGLSKYTPIKGLYKYKGGWGSLSLLFSSTKTWKSFIFQKVYQSWLWFLMEISMSAFIPWHLA